MNDLLTSIEEGDQERAGIIADSGIEVTEDALQTSKAIRLVDLFFPKEGKELGHFIDAIERGKGKEYAESLRIYCRKEWSKRVTQNNGVK